MSRGLPGQCDHSTSFEELDNVTVESIAEVVPESEGLQAVETPGGGEFSTFVWLGRTWRKPPHYSVGPRRMMGKVALILRILTWMCHGV